MSKLKSNIPAFEYHYKLIGIISLFKQYRTSFIIDSALNIQLEKYADFKIDNKKEKTIHSFELFVDEKQNRDYFLFNNSYKDKSLFRTYKGFEFVLLIKQETEVIDIKEIIKSLKGTKNLRMVTNKELKKIDETFIKKEILYDNLKFEEDKKIIKQKIK